MILTSSEIRESFNRLMACPHCGGPVILHRDGVTCQRWGCGGIFQPKDMGIEHLRGRYVRLHKLREAFPELASDRMTAKQLREGV